MVIEPRSQKKTNMESRMPLDSLGSHAIQCLFLNVGIEPRVTLGARVPIHEYNEFGLKSPML